jgi:rubredoxin
MCAPATQRAMPYYECPVCGGGYVIDPAPPHPTCDRDGAALKRASEDAYTLNARDDEGEVSRPSARRKSKSR